MEKLTIRLSDDVREIVEQNAESKGVSMSEYIRSLVESDVRTAPRVSLPKGLRDVVDKDLGDGLFRDESECILHYIREGMRNEGRLSRPVPFPRQDPFKYRGKRERDFREPLMFAGFDGRDAQ